VRPAQPGDEELLRAVYASTREGELAVVNWDDAQKDAFVRHQFAAQHRWYTERYEKASFDVIVVDGQAVGRLYVARWAEEIRVVDIAVLPDYRNRGIGSALLRDLMAEAAAVGKPLSIHVERFNPAVRLYARLGFAPAGDAGVYLLMRWSAT
jgi:GNAT superfamily N-acetyltransferase